MSEFEDAIKWMKNGEVQVLFFVLRLHGGEESDPLLASGLPPAFKFFDYRRDSRYPVSLLEWTGREDFSSDKIENLIEGVFSFLDARSLAVICMFDGAYLASEDLFEPENLEQIFAFQFNGERCLALKDDFRRSEAWKSSVRRMQADALNHFNA